jgi:hypothetical protein
VSLNSYRRLLRRKRGALLFVGLGAAFALEVLLFVGLIGAVGFLRASGFVPPSGFEWTAVALLPLYFILLTPTATGVELQTQIDARKLLPYPLRVRELFLGAAVGRAFGLLVPIPFLAPPIVAAFLLSPSGIVGFAPAAAATALLVFQGIFLAQLLTLAFQSSVSSRRARDTLAFVAVFVAMLIWAALQLWVFGNLGSREALVGRLAQGNLPPVLVGRVMVDPWGPSGLSALALLSAETVATFVVGVVVSHYFLNVRVPTKPAARAARAIKIPTLPVSAHANLLLWKDRIYLRRDPFVKAAAYGTLMLVVVAIVSSSTTRSVDPRQSGGFFLAIFSFLAPWTFLLGLGANLFGVEDGLAFLFASPADRRAFLRAKAIFLVGMATGLSGLTLTGCAAIFDRLDLLPTSVAFTFTIALGLTAAAMLSSAFFPSHATREGFRRKSVSGAGLATFTFIGIMFLIPVAFASGLPTLFGSRLFLFATLPAAAAVELMFLRSSVDAAVAHISRDEGDVLLKVKA